MRVAFLALSPGGDDRRAIDSAIARVLDRGLFVLGPEVEAFEQEFAAACAARQAVGVATGTDAIALILRALGIGAGDEVITTPLSAAFTALAIVMAGARPVFADVDPVRLTLDPRAAEAAITSRTRALLPVHLYGQAADMPALCDVAGRHGLSVVEDCCQAHLATCQGRPVGAYGIAAAYSFYPTKNLGALGDGGAATTNDPALAARIRRLRNGGQIERYRHVEAGVNSRLDEVQAAVLRARLPRLPQDTVRRRELAGLYRQRLLEHGDVIAVPPELDAGHVYHLFVGRSHERDALRAHLSAAGVETLVHYPIPLHRQPAFADAPSSDCPIADAVCDDVLSLPLHPRLSEDAVEEVAKAIATFQPVTHPSEVAQP